MKFLSVCSGIEAASVAWKDYDFECVGVSEIDKFASAVLNYRYPSVPNLGDMTKYKEWNNELQFEILVGGTPCQSFSVAGLRKGMDDPRGNLALTYVGIAEKYKPKWFIWENVPGVLSSNGGKDFSSFLSAMAEIGYGVVYRILDAQFFGVPQRRRRVFAIGYFGDWRPAAAVLFEPTSVFGNSTKSRKKGQDITPTIKTNSRTNGEDLVETQFWNGNKIAEALTATSNDQRMPDKGRMQMILEPSKVKAIPYDLYQITAPINKQNREVGDPCHTLARDNAAHASIIEIKDIKTVHSSLTTTHGLRQGPSSEGISSVTAIFSNTMQVRRLTPVECERLQGFPDNWTQVPYGKKTIEQCPLGHRYKALGNSMAVPVMSWIGRRISLFESLDFSTFDSRK